MGCALLDEAERVVVFLPPIFSVLLYDKPVPGMPTVLVTRPLLLTDARAPLTPAEMPTDFLPILSRTPGAIFTDFRNLNPIA